MEPLGTRQMKWLDYFMWNYHMESCRLKKIWWDGNGERFDNPVEDSRGICYPMDHRFTFPGEVVFDLDLKSPYHPKSLARLADDITWYLKQEGEIPILCHSGGSGYHIHVFKRDIKVAEDLCKDIIIRFKLQNCVGYGKVLDVNLLHNNHMIRIIGGRKYIGRQKYRYKSIINKARNFEYVTSRDKVVFPTHDLRESMKANMDALYIMESLNQIGNTGTGIKKVERSVLDTRIDL